MKKGRSGYNSPLSDCLNFELGLVKAIRSDINGAASFEAYYYALRFCRTRSFLDLDALLCCDPRVLNYTWADVYAIAQYQALFKKRDDLPLGVDTAQAAKATFLISEAICKVTNEQLRNRADANYSRRSALLFRMQTEIARILGSLPDISRLDFGFGPGQNVGCGNITNVTAKLTCDATATVAAAMLLKEAWSESNLYWPGLRAIKIVGSSRFATVPKTWKTDRPICVEPIINTFLQKGIGSYIRARLRLFGVNLNDQSKNRSLALRASRDGSLATIDLSMASDLIAYFVVMDLLPFPWFDLLDKARTPSVSLGDQVIELEKFSAMGNGYTFELESLIFYALLRVICGKKAEISVYGDDLICPTENYADVIDALQLLGFIPNTDKSFSDGGFRESCGGDYWYGTDVRPFFQRSKWRFRDLFRISNQLRETGYLVNTRRYINGLIPLHLRCWGPAHYGDGCLHSDTLPIRCKGGSSFVRVTSFVARSASNDSVDPESDFSAFLYYTTFKHVPDKLYETYGYVYRSLRVRFRRRTSLCPILIGRPG